MHSTSLATALVCLLCACACTDSSPAGPTVPLNRAFTLAPGQSASIHDTPLRVEFLRVSGDSRCPADAFCIQGGDAIVHVRAMNGRTTDYELHTGDRSRAAVVHAGLRIELVELQPDPFSSRTTEHGDYRATLSVTR